MSKQMQISGGFCSTFGLNILFLNFKLSSKSQVAVKVILLIDRENLMSVEVLFENKIYEKEFKDKLAILLKINSFIILVKLKSKCFTQNYFT
jgi:hypothetical protein